MYLTKYKTMVWGTNYIYLIQKSFGHLKTWWENWDSMALWSLESHAFLGKQTLSPSLCPPLSYSRSCYSLDISHFIEQIRWCLQVKVQYAKNVIKVAGTSLVVQRLRFQTPNAGGRGSIPSQGTRSHVLQLWVCMAQLKIPCAATWEKDPACHS